jgi:predicted enzyme related to lactoylglutathione lyase
MLLMSLFRNVVPVNDPNAPAAPGGITGGPGYRYWTMTIDNLDDVLREVEAAGRKIVWPRREVRPGVVVAMIEDPDGNWVEFIQAA